MIIDNLKRFMTKGNQMDLGNIVRWQADLVNTKKRERPVCSKPYHTNNGFQQNGEEIKKLWNYALLKQNKILDYKLLHNTIIILCLYDAKWSSLTRKNMVYKYRF